MRLDPVFLDYRIRNPGADIRRFLIRTQPTEKESREREREMKIYSYTGVHVDVDIFELKNNRFLFVTTLIWSFSLAYFFICNHCPF